MPWVCCAFGNVFKISLPIFVCCELESKYITAYQLKVMQFVHFLLKNERKEKQHHPKVFDVRQD